MTLQSKLETIETLSLEILAEIEALNLPDDNRSGRSKHGQLEDKLIAAQIVFNIRILIENDEKRG